VRGAQLSGEADDSAPSLWATRAAYGAAWGGQLRARVVVFLAAGADVNLASYAGRTPLMGVAMNGHVPLVRRFLGAGAQLKRPQERTRERERGERGPGGLTFGGEEEGTA
jgi:hypothetical protein